MRKVQAVADRHGFGLHGPTSTLSAEQMDKLLYGTGNETYRISLSGGRHFDTTYEGVIGSKPGAPA